MTKFVLEVQTMEQLFQYSKSLIAQVDVSFKRYVYANINWKNRLTTYSVEYKSESLLTQYRHNINFFSMLSYGK